ncbi:MAG: amino acid permease [Deltaproteobacteria bacterium]|jgi:APA family basic amino acid/polyamine antiporter|nr:amino acid permease [Deltaproteobacteria bacterium]MBW2532216.1 amino acid permease [Deltaproteobacteria bacterium]
MTADAGSRPKRQLGLWMATCLVIGNMIGSGIFLLPAALAPHGGYSLIAWLITSAGAVVLALVFGRLARRIPRAGGPYAFAREGFGDFAGFFMAWGYWISIIATNAAVASALVSYLTVFWPALSGVPTLAMGAVVGTIWILTLLNASGIRNGGVIQVVTTVMKLVPLVLIGTVGLWYVRPEAFSLELAPERTALSSINAAVALTLWAFLGFESATIPAENVADPKRTIPRATVLGTCITAVVYIASTVVVVGVLPTDVAARSAAPFADAGRAMWGGWAAYVMGLGAIVSCFGALNGWILIQGQIPMAMARDGVFPKLFARTRPDGTPATAIVISSVLATLLLLFSFSGTLVELFTKTILLATLTSVVPMVFASLTELKLVLGQGSDEAAARPRRPSVGSILLPIVGFAYALWAIIGAGQETVYLGFLLLLAGLPLYVWLRTRA